MSFIVPAVLGGLALSVMALVSIAAHRRGKHPSPTQQTPVQFQNQARILVHAINDDRCVGCDACVAVCPTNVLDLVNNKSRVLRFQDCIQCEACMWACPTDALVMHPEGTEPPKLKVPELDEHFQTAIPGQYLIGEVAGKPLVKNAANLGRAAIEHMLANGLQPGQSTENSVDVAIVGSGPGGLSAALACIRKGLSYVILEKEQMIASTVSRYPKGKWVMAEPYDVRNLSFLPVFDSRKEDIVPIWEQLVTELGVNIKMGEAVESVTPQADGTFEVRTTVNQYRAQRVILGIGTRGKPRTIGVPGENLPKVRSLLEDPEEFRGQAILVIGGGDSAVEAAMALADAGARVVLSYRGRAFNRAQAKNKQSIESYAAQKRVKILYQSQVAQFTEDTVTLQLADGQQKTYPNQAAFTLIGADPPIRWLEKVGVHFVERPHSYALGKTDDLVTKFAGNEATDCPEDVMNAAALVRDGYLSQEALAHVSQQLEAHTIVQGFEPVSGPRKWLRSATTMFTSAFRIDQPMPLSEFAKRQSRRMHTGHGRRDALSASERTRVLRMLRDEGGRLADEDTKMLRISDAAPTGTPPPPVHQQQGQPVYPQAMPTVQQHHMAQPGHWPNLQQPNLQQPNLQHPDPQQQQQAAPMVAQQHNPQAAPMGKTTIPAYQQAKTQPSSHSRRFDEEPTRQVDADVALAALLDGGADVAPGDDSVDDAAATQALPRDLNAIDRSSGEPTRIGHVGMMAPEMQQSARPASMDEPTRAMDVSAWLRPNARADGTPPEAPAVQPPQASPGGPAPSQGRPLHPDEVPTRAINIDPPQQGNIDPQQGQQHGRRPPQPPPPPPPRK